MKTTEIKSFYNKYGYIALEQFMSNEDLYNLKTNTERFIKEVIPTLPETEVYYEDKNELATLKQVQHLDEFDDYFKSLAASDKITDLASLLLGGKAVLKNMQYFNKIPQTGKETPAHQDGYYFMIRPQEALTMWLSLGDANAENGAVCYIPESHKKGMRNHGHTTILGFSQGIADWSNEDDKNEIQMEAGPGDMLVHHSLTIHRANANQSQRDRKSIGFIFYRDDVTIDEKAHAAYKARLDDTLKNEGKI